MIKKYTISRFLCLTLIYLCLVACENEIPKEDISTLLDSLSKNDSTVFSIKETPIQDTTVKTDVETMVDESKRILETIQELAEIKRKNDSIKLAKREKKFAYQLGLPLKSEKLVREAYENLTNTEGVRVLKKSRHEYLLILYEGKDEATIDEELEQCKEDYGSEVIGEIRKIDLMLECGKNKEPFRSDPIKHRRSKIEIECLTCDN
jgi:hypothetical protein